MNVAAPEKLTLEAKYTATEGSVFLTGVQALVRLPLDQVRIDALAGLRTAGFASGYPGSPLGRLDSEFIANSDLLGQHRIVHVPGLNEELAATAAWGSQVAGHVGPLNCDGVISIWYGKAPGLDRATDPLRHATFCGTTRYGGGLAYVGDDPGAKSSTLPGGSEHALVDLGFPVFSPGTTQEILDLGLHAVALSRASGLWAALKIVTPVADGAGTAEVGPGRVVPNLDDELAAGRLEASRLNPPGILGVEQDLYEVRYELARRYAALNDVNPVTVDPESAWIGIMAPGHTYHRVVDALDQLGLGATQLEHLGVRLLRVGMLWPLDRDRLRTFARGLEELLVVEEKRPFLESQVRDLLYGTPDAPRVIGKRDEHGEEVLRPWGTLEAADLISPLAARLSRRIDPGRLRRPDVRARQLIPLATRTMYFCSGCPHNTSLQAPEGALVGAGIGCHSMIGVMPPARIGVVTGVTQMGGEGAQWIGAAPFVDADHTFQNLGDGTFFHSGQLAVQAAIAAGSNITYKLLFNRAIAMTGGQSVPGELDVPAVVEILLTQGVRRIIVTADDPSRYARTRLPVGAELWDRARIVEAQVELAGMPGVTFLIHDQQCAAELRRLRKRGLAAEPATRVLIAERVCEGCGDCGTKSNCLSVLPVDTEFGRKTAIDQTSCNKDYSCVQGDCPSFVTFTPARRRRSSGPRPAAPRSVAWMLAADDVPEPARIVPTDDCRVRMPGVGGTGVVTVSQILGTAAQLDGLHVSGLDQTGMSQKGGTVVSDLRITAAPAVGANRVVDGGVDLFLCFDLLAAVSPPILVGASAARTVTVASTHRIPTGQMIADPEVAYPDEGVLLAALDDASRTRLFLDPVELTERLFGTSTAANIALLGAAYQLGAVVPSALSIEQAIELNGVAVDTNVQAFRWGRLYGHDRERVARALGATVDAVGSELDRLLAIRIADLTAYQNARYARRYADRVEAALRREREIVDGSTLLAETVARQLHRLMAYKDEYEVARLLLDPQLRAEAEAIAKGPVKLTWNLHPPMLRARGLRRKLRFGGWSRPVFAGLRGMKWLRGTAFDPFGRADVRRAERALVGEYEQLVDESLAALTSDNLAQVRELLSLPELVRGYEEIKLRNVERYRDAVAKARVELGLGAMR